ncbi:MAG: NAD(P)H-quinone oxidoreductase [Proteobacteria bacterium]|nr:NAD(P)H-quinone oxidoreductase [Pseudomonadota bacterium]
MPMTLPQQMRQARFVGAGGPDVIQVESAPLPVPGAGQVLVKVAAAGVNRPDCLQRAGNYPPPPGATEIPGLEIAGTIVGVGEGVSPAEIGREICALVISGGYAEYCVADLPLCLPIPKGLNLIEASGIPENYYTVYDNVFTRGRLKKGETILIHGGSSGIGSTAIQLAKAFGATVYATAGTDEKCDFCRKIGADEAINYRKSDFSEEVRRLTDKRGVDVILDMVGGPYIAKNLNLLALEGRLVQIAFLQPSVAEVDFMPLMLKRLTMTGSTLRARSVALKAEIAEKLRAEVWPLLDSGKVRPFIDTVYPLAEAAQSHAHMEASTHAGKIILEMR